MATAAIKVCDRPGCGKQIKGGAVRTTMNSEGIALIEDDALDKVIIAKVSVDLCDGCCESLRLWWTTKTYRAKRKDERRAAAKEGASQ